MRAAAGRLCAVLAALSVGTIAAAPDEPVVISSGSADGGYWSAATRLQTVAQGLGLEVEVLESPGSLQNLELLDDPASQVNLALAQADALQFYFDQHPEFSSEIEILEDIGQECVFLITGRDSGINSVSDLQGLEPRRLAIASADSGVAVTFDYMKTLVPEMGNTQVVYTSTKQALAEMLDGSAAIDAVMVVHRPKEHSPELDLALKEPDNYQLAAVADERFGSKLPNGERVYNALNLALPGENNVRTICTKGLLVSNKLKIPREQRYQLDEIIDFHWMRVYVPGS